MNPSRNLFLIGPTGAGKTSLGRRLAAHYGLRFIDLDREIERRTGTTVNMVFEVEGEAGFRQREGALLDEFSACDGVLLATGAGAVLAAHNRARLAESGYVLWLQTTIDQQLERLEHDTRRPLLAGADRRTRLEAMAAIRDPLYRETADLALPAIHGIAAISAQAIALIDRHWQRQTLSA
ncbi:shikimate kinase [Rhodanobacter sp. DHB23]|uniref:shikimate kinase n=1 Tax=Rhodanobacter sp. DHB23 TaxID=2775923 RepID=UPI001784A1B8|nr:shikimate kinase [Rhodanobacter sp. DHB23]MBD8872402.1 shikimate kinase [Rhodanobacter sp. DHB23]